MRTIRRTARVPYSAAQMFDLVNDVESYPQFLHWCRDARIERREGDAVEASVDIGISGIHQSFKTRNRIDRPHRIDLELLSGPFRRLEGYWRFEDAPDGGCEVELSLHFDISHSPLHALFGLVFEELIHTQVAAFVERAKQVYG